ncbi:MAG: Crp/Fnr family transcriptional regulator [Gammaproteobacteria bacterium]|nr:Crp/Fnr family transcriptional regulator [Gammaproteobacteria bacterium]
MAPPSRALVLNKLIDELPREQCHGLLEQCTPVTLCAGDVLCESGKPLEHVHFPMTALISLVKKVRGNPAIEMGMIGREGMLGATLALEISSNPVHAVVHGAGTALRIPTARFKSQLRSSPALRHIVELYLYVLIEQLAQKTACNTFHTVPARLASRLLMTHDRLPGEQIEISVLARMLGVGRAALTIAAGELRQRGLIDHTTRRIRVLSRADLEGAACECYAAGVNAYRRRLPPRPGAWAAAVDR